MPRTLPPDPPLADLALSIELARGASLVGVCSPTAHQRSWTALVRRRWSSWCPEPSATESAGRGPFGNRDPSPESGSGGLMHMLATTGDAACSIDAVLNLEADSRLSRGNGRCPQCAVRPFSRLPARL